MILLVDIGNTQIKWAELTADGIQFGGVEKHLDRDFHQLLTGQWARLAKPDRILVSNVAGASIRDHLLDWVKQRWQQPVEFITAPARAFNIENAYANPEKFGSDRWLGLVAARQEFTSALCTVGCGTAITIDALKDSGKHLGGLIVPGLELMRFSLAEHTVGCAMAKDFALHEAGWLGKNTEDAVINGSLIMTAAFINHITQRLQTELGDNITFVITGGDGQTLLPMLNAKFHHRPYLVLEGLAAIARAK